MERTIPLGEVFATRELEFTHSNGRKETVQVLVGRPVCVDQSQQEWWCPYLVKAESFEKQHRSIGGDSMQALILSTQIISTQLHALARQHNGTFTYLGESNLHFPE